MDRVHPFTVTTPAGTLQSAPQSTDWELEDARLLYVELIIPNGHSGTTGLRIEYQGTQIIPWGDVSYIVANDERITFPFNDQITRSGLTIITYNVDVFDHSHYLRAAIMDLPEPNVVQSLSGQPMAVAQEELPLDIVTDFDFGTVDSDT